ncbi:MAG: hypothetical protein ABIH99_06110 [Candidatus Micrarchaeota archaeon]
MEEKHEGCCNSSSCCTANHKPVMILAVAVLLCVAFAAGYTYYSSISPCTESTIIGTPTHNQTQVEEAVKEFLVIQYGVVDTRFVSAEFSEGIWNLQVDFTAGSLNSSFTVAVNDSNLSIDTLYEKAILGGAPGGIVPLQGKINCAPDGEGSVNVMEFIDPYCPFSISNIQLMNELRTKFGSSLEYEPHLTFTHSLALAPAHGLSNITTAYNYIACAREQGKFDEYRVCFTNTYTKHEEVPLTLDELNNCAVTAQLDNETLKTCLENDALDLVDFDNKLGQTYFIDRTPLVVVNCQYKTRAPLAEYAICYEYPETKGCENFGK